jgi:hypothetical protein
MNVRFEVFTAVTMKNAVFWDVTPCGSCKNRRFGGTYHIIMTTRIGELETTLAVISNRSMLMMEAIRSSETLVLTRGTRHNNPENGIRHKYGPPRAVTRMTLL